MKQSQWCSPRYTLGFANQQRKALRPPKKNMLATSCSMDNMRQQAKYRRSL